MFHEPAGMSEADDDRLYGHALSDLGLGLLLLLGATASVTLLIRHSRQRIFNATRIKQA
jgi:hypothetical protein